MECLILGIAAILLSLWRLAWLCLILPLWRVGKWIAAGQAKLDRDARAAAPGSKKTSYVAPWEGQTGRPPTVEECEAALRRLKA